MRIRNMRQDTRDIAHSGLYLGCVALLVGSVAFAGAAVVTDASDSPLFSWAASSDESSAPQSTHISRTVANARAIRAALARPIPGPDALPPITEKVAIGRFLRHGGANAMARSQRSPVDVVEVAADAPTVSYRASSAVIPELHKVY